MKLLLLTLVLALVYASAASARNWPRPPAWWMNSRDMVAVRNCESGNGRDSRNLYGMKDAWPEVGGRGGKTGAWSASYAEQHYRAWLFWRRHGCHGGWGVWEKNPQHPNGCC